MRWLESDPGMTGYFEYAIRTHIRSVVIWNGTKKPAEQPFPQKNYPLRFDGIAQFVVLTHLKLHLLEAAPFIKNQNQRQLRSENILCAFSHPIKSLFYSALAKMLASLCWYKCTTMKQRGRGRPRRQQSSELQPVDSYEEANATELLQTRLPKTFTPSWSWKDSREP